MKIAEIIHELEQLAPMKFQESYDNSGLIVGDKSEELVRALFCLDSTEEVVDEAIENNCNMIIAHHPILFEGIKSLTGKNYIERTLLKAIKNDIAIYAIHTNLDNVSKGVNHQLAKALDIKDCRLLGPKGGLLKKLVFFCPKNEGGKVKQAIFQAGAGQIGEYDCCSYQVEGKGSFRAGENAKPFIGKKGEIHMEDELRIETIMPAHIQNSVIKAMLAAHPYEEVAYDIYELAMNWKEVGSGMIGQLDKPMNTSDYLDSVKQKLNVSCIRHTKLLKKEIQQIAICGGSGSFLLSEAINAGAELFITADYKYHQFFDAEDKIVIVDVGHYESEQFTPQLLANYLQEKISDFNPYLSTVNTNPVYYR